MAEESNWKRGQRFHCTNVACVLFRSRLVSDMLLLRWCTMADSCPVESAIHALDTLFTHWTHCSRTGHILRGQNVSPCRRLNLLASGARVWISSCCSFLPASVSSPFSAVSNSSCELALAQYILTAGKAH